VQTVLEVSLQNGTEVQGSLFFDATQLQRLTSLAPKFISISQRFQAGRRTIEALIEEIYQRCYGTRLAHHYPTLMSVHGVAGPVLAAVGFRAATDGPLFLEQYLERGIEETLGAALGIAVARNDIVEIGNLASTGDGASVFLFVALAAYLRQHDYRYAVVTATNSLRRTFKFLGFEPVELAMADRSRLPDAGASWGSYYTRDPRVLASAIAPCFACLERFLPVALNGEIGRMFPPADWQLPDAGR